MAVYNSCIITWLDKNGNTATSFWTTIDQSGGGAGAYAGVAAAAQSCSDAAVVGVQFQGSVTLAATPGDGPYCTVLDRARMLARITGTGKPTRQEIVAPKSSLFLADQVTVDLTNGDIIALQTEIEAVIGDTSGNPQGPYYRGLRATARARR